MNTSQLVLQYLLQKKEQYTSGQEIANYLELSRNAIWKAINKLQENGYTIESKANKGYKIIVNNDILSASGIQGYLQVQDFYKIQYFDEVTSTNTLIKNETEAGTVIVAASQSAGRGRFNRSFYSPKDSGVYFSVLLKPDQSHDISFYTALSAIAVCRSIQQLTNKKPQIKWVNDIFLDDKKICGILTEASYNVENGQLEALIIGIGLNIYEPIHHFPNELKDIAGSLLDKTLVDSRNQFVASILNQIYLQINNFDVTKIHQEYKALSCVLNKEITYLDQNQQIHARVIDINEFNELVVKKEDGTIENLRFGEISIKLGEKNEFKN